MRDRQSDGDPRVALGRGSRPRGGPPGPGRSGRRSPCRGRCRCRRRTGTGGRGWPAPPRSCRGRCRRTRSRRCPIAAGAPAISRRPPSGIALRAFVARFQKICEMPSGSATRWAEGGSRSSLSRWLGPDLGAVLEQLEVLGQQARHVEVDRRRWVGRAYSRKPLIVRSRRWLSLSRMPSSRLLRRVVVLERESICTEPEIGGERVADLVGEARRQRADGGHAVLHPDLLLELAPGGEVLEDDDRAGGDAVGVLQLGQGEADVDRSLLAHHLDLAGQAALPARVAGEVPPLLGRDEAGLAHVAPDQILLVPAQDLAGGPVACW